MSRFSRFTLLAALALATAPAASAQTFAVGLGGSVVNDTGTAANVGGFDFTGFHAFGELTFDRSRNVLLQVRYSRFGLPRGADDAPNLRVDAGLLSMGYFFQDAWWRAGFQAGLGVYHVVPKPLEPGQSRFDPREDVVGWHGGLVSVFDVSSRVDVRVEAIFHSLRTAQGHRPIFLTGVVAYRF